MGKMASGGFGNPSIFPKNRLFCIFKWQFFKNFQNFRKNFENFFEKKIFLKKIFFAKFFWKIFFFVKKFFGNKILENFLKNRRFSSQILIFSMKKLYFSNFWGAFGASKMPPWWFWCSKKGPPGDLGPPLWPRPPYNISD